MRADGWLYAATPDAVEELLRGGGEFNTPEHTLGDLTGEQATVVPPGAPNSIAQIVAHMSWNLEGVLAELQGEHLPDPDHLDDTFAPVESHEWPGMRESLLRGIERCKTAAREKADATSPARDDTNVGYDLAEAALHNAYHLGQIVLLRRMLGFWPPAGGDRNDF